MNNKHYLKEIIKNINFDDLPQQWQQFDLVRFSREKKLFDFQQEALKNCLKALYFYFKQKNANKSEVFNHYRLNGLTQDLDFKLKEDKKTVKYLLEYPEDYPVIDSRISFAYFINRMSFWMATGSGKTLVIVKLIEILGKLINSKELPSGDILFLSHREDLLDQFKNHIAEFNGSNFDTKINLIDLKDYDKIKQYGSLTTNKNEINIFYYRSDLISDEQKEKILDFRNYDNKGKWYIILDEAHKGDKEESKRQIFYSILSRNGFLFNFSATFVDPKDYNTCAFNFNLSQFVKEGYGKHLCLSSLDITAFKDKTDFSSIEKQKIVLKTILLFIYIKKCWEEINKYDSKLYHRPLMVALVNSVDTEDSDLELFFREIVKIATNEIKKDFLENVTKELLKDFNNYEFKFEDITIIIDEKKILSLTYNDILKYFFNSTSSSTIEVLKIPQNKNEMIFKLKSTPSPFALVKIGDISKWIKEKLEGYEIIETFDNESYFKRINEDDSVINILMGSRTFYEGWDSNRPNIILFLNIGIRDAKIFVLQSIGRGVRIEPKKNLRKRFQNLFNENLIDKELFEKIKDKVLFLETLFIFGTKAKNLEEIINTLDEVDEVNLGEAFIINPQIGDKPLLIPIYSEARYLFENQSSDYTLPVNKKEFDLALDFYNFLKQNNSQNVDKILLVKYDLDPIFLLKLNEIFEQRFCFAFHSKDISTLDSELIIRKILNFLKIKSKDCQGFEKLEKDKFIVHFKNICFRSEKFENYKRYLNELKDKIEIIKNKPNLEKELDKLFEVAKDRKEYDKKLELIKNSEKFEVEGKKIRIKNLLNHYYIPLILPENERIEYLSHIINVKSEIEFIENLEAYIKSKRSFFSFFDWWFFSKIDEHLDEVYIPYYDEQSGKIATFKPDFIFWAKKGDNYLIFFVDPKSTEFTKPFKKIDGYCKIFETEKNGKKEVKIFSYENLKVKVKLFLWSEKSNIPLEYSNYWVNSFEELGKRLGIYSN